MFETGRVCVKTAGREAGKYCVVLKKEGEMFVLVTGPKEVTGVRKRKCNITHLEPLNEKLKISATSTDSEVAKAFDAAKLHEKLKVRKLTKAEMEELSKKREEKKEKKDKIAKAEGEKKAKQEAERKKEEDRKKAEAEKAAREKEKRKESEAKHIAKKHEKAEHKHEHKESHEKK